MTDVPTIASRPRRTGAVGLVRPYVETLAMVAASTQRTAAGQRAWIEKSGQVKAFDTLAQRHQAREDRLDQRREQKALDEHAARSHADKEAEG